MHLHDECKFCNEKIRLEEKIEALEQELNETCDALGQTEKERRALLLSAEYIETIMKYLRGLIEKHLQVQHNDWDDIGFGTVSTCPICKAEGGGITPTDVKHKPDCYWSKKKSRSESMFDLGE